MHFDVVLVAFAVVFLGELPDKTMFATLLLATRGRPLQVWIGAAAAFSVHVAIAVSAGAALFSVMSRQAVDGLAAGLFLGGAGYMWWRGTREGEHASQPGGRDSINGSGEGAADGPGERDVDGSGEGAVDGPGERDVDGPGERDVDGSGERDVDGPGAEPVDGQPRCGTVRAVPSARNPQGSRAFPTVEGTGAWRAWPVLSAFAVIFIAEWGDLTQVLTANLAGRYHAPLAVALGSLSAMWVVAGLAVVAGGTLLRVLNVATVTKIASLVLAGLAAFNVWSAVR